MKGPEIPVVLQIEAPCRSRYDGLRATTIELNPSTEIHTPRDSLMALGPFGLILS
jgi:hypothetical protein